MRKTAPLLLLGTMLCLPFFASARRVAMGTYKGSLPQAALVNANWDTYDIVIYTSVGVNADGTLAIPTQGTTLDAFKAQIIDRARAHNLKGMVSIGGRASGPNFVKAVQPQRVGQFVAAIKALVDRYNLAGVDIDWQYPGTDIGSCQAGTQDLEDFGNFIVQLKSTLALQTSPTSTLRTSTLRTSTPTTPTPTTSSMPTTSAPTSTMSIPTPTPPTISFVTSRVPILPTSAPTSSVPTSTRSVPTSTMSIPTTTTTTIPLPSSPTSTLPTPTPTSTMSSVVLHKLVTVTAPLNRGFWHGTGHAKIVGNSDYIIIKMNVDLDNVDKRAVPIAPLPAPSSAPSSAPSLCLSWHIDFALGLWTGVGIPLDKIILGVPTSGRRYAIEIFALPTTTEAFWTTYPTRTGQPKGSERDSPDEGDACRPGTGHFSGGVPYLDLFNSAPGFPALLVSGDEATPGTDYRWDVCSQTPVLYLSALKQLVMFDNPKSFAAKGHFVATGYAGFAVLDAQDDRNGELAQAIAQTSG